MAVEEELEHQEMEMEEQVGAERLITILLVVLALPQERLILEVVEVQVLTKQLVVLEVRE